MEGKGGLKDVESAIKYYEQAAKKDNLEAMFALGEIYLNSLLGHFDESKAIEWLTKAYKSGNSFAIENAIKYYEQAAKEGNQEAMLALGEIYLNSLLGHFDEPKAIDWFTKAYESGNRIAKEKLGYFYINGIHVKKNKKLGKKILAE